MFISWSGRGILALIATFPPLGIWIWLTDTIPDFAGLAAGTSLIAGGIACWLGGRRWNRPTNVHTFYGVPMQYWGIVYVFAGAVIVLLLAAGLIRKSIG